MSQSVEAKTLLGHHLDYRNLGYVKQVLAEGEQSEAIFASALQ
jgi:hypothetical protein